MFKEKFDCTTPTMTIDGTRILKPTLLLNAKCKSINEGGERKRHSDAADIIFLLTWCIEHDCLPSQEEVPNINRDFVLWFIDEFGKESSEIAKCWEKAGLDMEKGEVPAISLAFEQNRNIHRLNFSRWLGSERNKWKFHCRTVSFFYPKSIKASKTCSIFGCIGLK